MGRKAQLYKNRYALKKKNKLYSYINRYLYWLTIQLPEHRVILKTSWQPTIMQAYFLNSSYNNWFQKHSQQCTGYGIVVSSERVRCCRQGKACADVPGLKGNSCCYMKRNIFLCVFILLVLTVHVSYTHL